MRSLSLSGFLLLLCGISSGVLATFTINIDYSYDEDTANGGLNFFDPLSSDGLMARTTLEAAADEIEQWITDPFVAINPGGSNTYGALFFDPTDSGSATQTETDLYVAANSITIFAGAFTGGSASLLGQGGKGGHIDLMGSASFIDSVATRGGEAFETMWGGMIRFNADRTDWHLDSLSLPGSTEYDFYTVAIHELLHVVGIGQCTCWDNQVSGGEFSGSFSVAKYNETDADTANDLNPVPLGDSDHWDNSVMSVVAEDGVTPQEVLMGPSLDQGTRLELTELDLAGLADLEWNIVGINPIPEPAFAGLALGLVTLLWLRIRQGK